MLKKTDDNHWLVDIQPGGRAGKRVKRKFKTQAEAKRFEHHIQGQSVTKPWNPVPKDTRKLSELIEVWWKAHGQHLSAGANTKSRLLHFANQLGDPCAMSLSAHDFSVWRTKATTRALDPMKPNSVNRVHAYLRAMFSTLETIGEWKHTNPLNDLPQLRRFDTELRYLTAEEIPRLLTALRESTNPHAYPCTCLALATGARWSEAEEIHIQQLKSGFVRYHTRKNSQGGKWRTVPVVEELASMLIEHHREHGHLTGTRVFASCYSALREAIDRAKIDLPDGQLSHVLRHSFATTFLSSGGDIRTLQELLGHANITMTMRYAHLVESHLDQARIFNPLAKLAVSDFCWNKK